MKPRIVRMNSATIKNITDEFALNGYKTVVIPSKEWISTRVQFVVAMLSVVLFGWLVWYSYQLDHLDENIGYTQKERAAMDKKVQRALHDVDNAEKHREALGYLFNIEPDGTPVELYRNGSTVR